MRVLILNHNLRERGTWFRARRIARELHARGHDVTFVCTGEGYYRPRVRPSESGWTEWESAQWTPLREPGDGWSPLGILQRLWRLRGHFDLIYSFSHTPIDQAAARFLRRAGGFWITDWCDLWHSQRGGLHDTAHWSRPLPRTMEGIGGMLRRASFRWEDRLEFTAARDADAVTIIADPMRRYTDELRIPPERVLKLVSGSDTERITVGDQAAARAALNLPADRPVIGYVANVTMDNEQLAAALELVWQKHPQAIVLSVGPTWFDHATGPLAVARRERRLVDLGRRPFSDVGVCLAASDLLVMPLRDLEFNRCRWPNKFSDYMASGRATATCDVGDMGPVIREFGVGVAGAPTAEGLAQAMQTLLDQPALRQSCGTAARRAAETNFSWGHQMALLLNFLKSRGVAL